MTDHVVSDSPFTHENVWWTSKTDTQSYLEAVHRPYELPMPPSFNLPLRYIQLSKEAMFHFLTAVETKTSAQQGSTGKESAAHQCGTI